MSTDESQNVPSAEKANIIAEALPYMQRYAGETVVIKFGGHAMVDPGLAELFAQDIVLLKHAGMNPVVVHGGGPQIQAMLERLGITSEFTNGLRITDADTVEIVEMVLAGRINKQIVTAINSAGGRAVGLSGKDGSLIIATKLKRTMTDPDSNIERILDLGFVGEPERINTEILDVMADSDIIPVIAPIGVSEAGVTYNINADTVAGEIASALSAGRLLLLTDVPGVFDQDKTHIKTLSVARADQLIADGTISGGMIPKVENCIAAVRSGVGGVVILDGRVPHAVLLELLTEHGVGTLIS
ncbi:Acetylglutamate kinase [hydrothermal vent metagenome]|uniref:acetylglutamate kinase n=1 Tax=hydrothermal vent metagenome TaxID=652676 RepID=A0A3B0TD97_9ZZZZ